jgi:hypothetical protein
MSGAVVRRSRRALTVAVIVVLVGVVGTLAVQTHPPSARCNAWQAQIGWEAGDRARHGPPPGAAISVNSSPADTWAAWVSVLRGTQSFLGQYGEVDRPPGC